MLTLFCTSAALITRLFVPCSVNNAIFWIWICTVGLLASLVSFGDWSLPEIGRLRRLVASGDWSFRNWSFGEWSILGVPRIDCSEIGRSEIGHSEIGCSEIGRAEIGRSEIGPSEIGLSEIGLSENGRCTVLICFPTADLDPAGTNPNQNKGKSGGKP
jgi:hypothetical protein